MWENREWEYKNQSLWLFCKHLAPVFTTQIGEIFDVSRPLLSFLPYILSVFSLDDFLPCFALSPEPGLNLLSLPWFNHLLFARPEQ